MSTPTESKPQPPRSPMLPRYAHQVRQFLTDYAWWLSRNVVGWILMLAALPIGFALPGPFGLPLFLIGFALVTFPGKRRLTARVLRGRRLAIENPTYALSAAFVAIT